MEYLNKYLFSFSLQTVPSAPSQPSASENQQPPTASSSPAQLASQAVSAVTAGQPTLPSSSPASTASPAISSAGTPQPLIIAQPHASPTDIDPEGEDINIDDDDSPEPPLHINPPPSYPKPSDMVGSGVPSPSTSPNKLPNPLPPGMPTPPISSTSVVEPSDQMYTCPLCHEKQATQKEFTTHIRGHNEVKPHNDPNDPTGQSKVYFCCLCGKMLSSFSSLDRHMLVHSGERPFSCELCGQTFTTNGNMHRHKRTHGTRNPNAPGPNGTPMGTPGTPGAQIGGLTPEAAGAQNGQNGRHRVGRKRKQQLDSNGQEVKKTNGVNLTPNGGPEVLGFKCPSCPESFATEQNLDHHMYEAHPGKGVVCEQCNFTCPNYDFLKLHRTMFHFASVTKQVALSQALTQGLTQTPPSMMTAQTASAAAAAVTAALKAQRPLEAPMMVLPTMPIMPTLPPTSIARVPGPFLPQQVISAAAAAAAAEAAKSLRPLHIDTKEDPVEVPQTNDPQLSPEDDGEDEDDKNNDLPDVQSMLTLAKTGVDNIDKPQDSDTEASINEERTLSSHEGICLVEDPVIRDMKLKGEFPCRLCPAVYPNLRALKGHNKEHLGKPPYVCNVGTCTYSSNDKSTLTRHMRTHTGEKPFECKLCNYGFTTKANCERHLKNKHGKTSRDAIQTSIIIHESADDPDKQNIDSESGNSGINQPQEINSNQLTDQFRCKVCKQIFPTSAKVIAHAVKDHPAYSNDVDHIFEPVKKSTLSRLILEDGTPSMVPRPLAMIDQLKKPSTKTPQEQDMDSEAPLDLSRPSRPSSSQGQPSPATSTTSNPTPSIYSSMPPLKMHGKIPMMPPPPSAMDLLGFFPTILPPNPGTNLNPPIQPTGTQIRPTGFPFPFPLPILPTNLMNFMPNLDSLPPEIKEQMKQRLGVGGASLDLAAIMQQEILRKQTELKEQKEAAEALQHLSEVNSLGSLAKAAASVANTAPPLAAVLPKNTSAVLQASPITSQNTSTAVPPSIINNGEKNGTTEDNKSDSDTNYKMVIKNGVLMKKQKQRRYRTERPYSCNLCEARFTLR